VLRVLQFADIVNRHDFIDIIVRHADPSRFHIGVCVRTKHSNIATPVYSPATPYWVIEGLSRYSIPYAALRLARLLRKWDADILHTHHYDQALIGLLATRIHKKTRLILGRHYSDAVITRPAGVKRRLLLAIEQATNRASTRIIVPSHFIMDILTKRQGVNSDKIDLIPYGFDSEKYKPPDSESIARIRNEMGLEGHFSIGTFARLHPEKGHRFLLQAIASLKHKLPNLLAVFLGEGMERTAINKQILDEGLQHHVRLLGMRRDAVPVIMAALDAVVQPTLHEAFSQVMIEALWMRKPLVITDVSGVRDVIRNGENGLIVPPGDASALAEAIELVAANSSLCRKLGEGGRAFVESGLKIERIIRQYEQAYLRAMGS
jgi:glycosyltransferase involved in cell wall biosynthesis